jgi:hypothetical protein
LSMGWQPIYEMEKKNVWNHQPAIHKLLAVGICWSHNYGISEKCFSFFGEHVVLVVETGTGCFPPLSTTKDCQPAHWNARVHWLESRNRIPTSIDILSILGGFEKGWYQTWQFEFIGRMLIDHRIPGYLIIT